MRAHLDLLADALLSHRNSGSFLLSKVPSMLACTDTHTCIQTQYTSVAV